MSILSKILSIFNDSPEPDDSDIEFGILATDTEIISGDFTADYNTAEAERGKFVVGDLTADVFDTYPGGRGKYAMLTYDVADLDAVDFTQSYNTAEAERGKFVKLDLDSTETGYPSGGRGRYAVLTYNVNSSTGTASATYLPLAGGTMSGNIDMGGGTITNASLIEFVSASFITELSGFSVAGDVEIDGGATITGLISTTCGTSEEWCSTHTTTQTYSGDWLDGSSTGLLSGGVLSTSISLASGFDITAGVGRIVDHTTTPTNPVLTTVTWEASSNIVPTNIATTPATYIAIDSSGNIVERSNFPTAPQRRDEIFIGVAVHSDNTTVNVVNNLPNVGIDIGAQTKDILDFLGFRSKTGNTITHSASGLTFIKNAGVGFKGGQNFQTDSKAPHEFAMPALDPVTFRYRTQTSTETGNLTDLDPTTYDVAGTPTSMGIGVNKASIQQAFIFPSNIVRVQYGQQPYASFAEALADVGTEEFVIESNIAENGLFLGYIVLDRDATDLSDPQQARFIPSTNVGSGAGFGSTLQNAYDLSVTPEIITDASRGALTLKSSTATASSIQIEVENVAGDIVWSVTDLGVVSASEVYADCGNSTQWCSTYTTVQGASGSWGGGSASTIESETATTFTINTSSEIVLVDATAGAATVNLLPAVGNQGKRQTVKKIDSTSNTVTLSANTNIDSQSTFIINNQYDAIEFISNGTQWWII